MRYVVAVRALCEFSAKQGDLDLRFTPSPTARQGIAGHLLVASRRGPNYEAEISLAGEYRELRVRGRADGYDAGKNQLEEVKTFRGALARMPENHRRLHWAQVKIYGWLLCQQRGLAEVRLALVYFDIGSQRETLLSELHTAEALRHYFEAQCARFVVWARQELAHRAARDDRLLALAFPHPAFRAGQRELAEAVYKAGSKGLCLMAQAPTGIGKTIGTVFPLLKAMPRQELDKVFFLAAKTSGRALALDALTLVEAGTQTGVLRVLELVARDKACEHPDKACHGDSCPLANGFYDRLPAARDEALGSARASARLDRQTVRGLALAHRVCPYYLSQELVRWSDVVVGDYNYYFDSSAMLHALTVANQWRVGILVDEAHNLVERGRMMYSAELDQATLQALRRTATPRLAQPLDRLNRAWRDLQKSPHLDADASYQVLPDVPAKFALALQQLTTAVTDELEVNPTLIDSQLQRFYFDALHFSRMAESFGEHSLFDIKPDRSTGRTLSRLCIRNVVPAPFLASRFSAARTATLFSATFGPCKYYADMLGLPAETPWIDVQSPFEPEQLSVSVVTDISTRFQHRELSLAPIVELMARQYARKPGNYLVFLSSYDYLEKLATLFRTRHPDIDAWEQTRGMEEAARDRFLARFKGGGRGLGFAVLGGSFAEGIDLPGDRLIGAFIATLGLPQVNEVNEEIRKRLGTIFGDGAAYQYSSLFPGLQKVVQAAGRVIRGTSDTGVIYLMDDRFSKAEVKGLLPSWWQVGQISVGDNRAHARLNSKHAEQHQQQDNRNGNPE